MNIYPPKRTVRERCKQCLGLSTWNRREVEDCHGEGKCFLFPYRLGSRIPVKVFRSECLVCQGGSYSLVRECDLYTCPLHGYRMGGRKVCFNSLGSSVAR